VADIYLKDLKKQSALILRDTKYIDKQM